MSVDIQIQDFTVRKQKWINRNNLDNENCVEHILDIFTRNQFNISSASNADIWYEIKYYRGKKALYIHFLKKQYDYILQIDINYKTQFTRLKVLQYNCANHQTREIVRNSFIFSNIFYLDNMCWVKAICDIIAWEQAT